MTTLFLMIYFRNRKDLFKSPKITKKYSVSFLVPAYNEEKTLEESIKHISSIDYSNIVEIIIINDCSKDKTLKIAKKLEKKYSNVVLLNNKTNLGKAGSLNAALKIAKGELIAVVDADSYPAKDCLRKMVGFFDDSKTGVVTVPVLVRNPKGMLQKLQSLEYKVIAFTRKLLEYLDAIYVTPGPLAVYRKTALLDIKGFDKKNMTEDIEATWHLTKNNWGRRMSLSSNVTSTCPRKFKEWFIQRRRWNIGGLQCIGKYKSYLFRRGIFGWFIIPLFLLSTFLGLIGLIMFLYLFTSRIISNYLFTKYSIAAGTPILTLNEFYITFNVLNYLGLFLFILGLMFTILGLKILNETIFKKENIINLPFYLIIYLTIYPLIMVDAIWHLYRGKYSWR